MKCFGCAVPSLVVSLTYMNSTVWFKIKRSLCFKHLTISDASDDFHFFRHEFVLNTIRVSWLNHYCTRPVVVDVLSQALRLHNLLRKTALQLIFFFICWSWCQHVKLGASLHHFEVVCLRVDESTFVQSVVWWARQLFLFNIPTVLSST